MFLEGESMALNLSYYDIDIFDFQCFSISINCFDSFLGPQIFLIVLRLAGYSLTNSVLILLIVLAFVDFCDSVHLFML